MRKEGEMRKTRNLCVSAAAVMLVLLALVLCGCRSTASAETLSPYERIDACRRQIEKITDFRPQVVIVLGSGLGDFVNSLDVKAVIPYSEIEGWPESTAPLHAGNLVFAEYKGLRIAVMQGRLHYYEGYTMEEVVLPLRVLHLLGAEIAILSNATGSLNPDFRVGEFVCVSDQISSFVPSPLIGPNIDQLGERFFGMTDVFDKDMQETVLRTGRENNIPVHSGVYIQVTGPQYETPAEIRMYRLCGADTVAMSLGAEVLAASHMGMKVCAINCISNMAAGIEEFTVHSINETMKDVVPNFTVLVDGLLDSLAGK
jgi:purine-nucleoside phosphorylase